ncbi:MAG: N-acetylmuramoyl-L-alanine amidase [Elusimicrobia bacterium]|nr:N-acetylmuramoyl-L-alanine amidase [Elusimicrobiota bacterium]
MQTLLAALACLAFAGTCASGADEGGMRVYFRGSSAARRIVVPPLARPGDILHDTGPSDPLPGIFDAILFHGRTQAGVGFEAQAGSADVWGPWTAPEIETFSNGRFWGRFRLSGTKGTSVRIRLVHRGVLPSSVIVIYEIEAYRTTREPVVVTPSRVDLSTRPGKPDAQSRSDWNAAPPKYDYTLMDIRRVTLHHTAGAQPEALEDARSEMRLIQRYHQAGRGWNDIGYHFVIDGAGRIHQGRPENALGAHALNHNTGNVGISFMGNYHPPIADQPAAGQIKTAVALVRWLDEAYGIAPEALFGHRDIGSTECPGDLLYPKVEEIRKAATQPVPPPGPAPGAQAPDLPAASRRLDRFDFIRPFNTQ